MALRSAFTAMLVAVPLALAGCSQGAPQTAAPTSPAPSTATSSTATPSTAAPSSESGAPDSESVAWTSRLCELIGGFAASQQGGPAVDNSSREAFKSSLVVQLDSALQAAGDTLTGLREMRPAPIEGGDGVTDAFEKGFVRTRDVLTTAKAKAEGIDTSSKDSFTTGKQAVQKELKKGQAIDFGAVFTRFNENRALVAAAAEAPSCKTLTNSRSQAPQPQQPRPPQPSR